VSKIDVDLYDTKTFVESVPYDYFARMRADGPISRHARPDGSHFWSVWRHADIEAIEADTARFSSTTGLNLTPLPEAAVEAFSGSMLIWSDPPRHTQLRKIISRGFTPRAIEHLADRVREMTRDAIDNVIEKGECDFVEVAGYLPVEVIAELMDVPEHDRGKLFDWTTGIFGIDDPECSSEARFAMTMMQLFGYARRLAARRREEPGTDVFSAIASAEVDGVRLSELELGSFFLLLATAGNETTRTLMLHGTKLLLEHPDALAASKADPTLIPGAVEEMLRFSSPVHNFGRTATEDLQLYDQKISKGDQVILWYASGNRDERVFADPDTFDIQRSNARQNLAFGTGPHFCMGAALARLEAKIFFEELLVRMPDLELAGPSERLQSNVTNGIKRMPVRFTPGAVSRPASERPHRPPVGLGGSKSVARRPTTTAPPAPANQEISVNIELVPLCTATLDIGTPTFIANGPKGTRVVAEITSTVWEGERLRGKQLGATAADWALISEAGTAAIDVRTTMETDDGAVIFVSYNGRSDYSLAGAGPVYAAPTFETGDERYAWLNNVQAIAKGRAEGITKLVYEVYEVR
jgi:cytochrome P450